jgi:hypothetical protein
MALERRVSTVSLSPWLARMAASRSMMAWKHNASPAVARAMINFKPCSEVMPSRTNRSWAAAAARRSAPSGSASMIAASNKVCSRPNDTAPTTEAMRSSTSAACAALRCLVV